MLTINSQVFAVSPITITFEFQKQGDSSWLRESYTKCTVDCLQQKTKREFQEAWPLARKENILIVIFY